MSINLALMTDAVGGFIVSTGRCGSTLLTRLLQEYSSALVFSEWFAVLGGTRAFDDALCRPDSFLRHLTTCDQDLWSLLQHGHVDEFVSERAARHMAEVVPIELITIPSFPGARWRALDVVRRALSGVSTQPTYRLHTHVFNTLTTFFGRAYWLERSGGSLEYLEHLIRCWPKAKYVHLWRDGVDTSLSMSRHPYFRLRVARLLTGDPTINLSRALSAPIPLQRFGAFWSAMIANAARQFARLESCQVLHVRYDDLVDTPESVLHRIMDFLHDPVSHVPLSVSKVAARSSLTPRSEGLPSSDLRSLERACSVGMRIAERLHSTSSRA